MKTPTRFTMRLPEVKPGNLKGWRAELSRSLKARNPTSFGKHERLAVKARLYLPATTWHKIDVDNVLKALMDALQGAIAGRGQKDYSGPRVVPEDNQVYEAHIVKRPAGPKKIGGVVTLTVLPGHHQTVRYAKVANR